MLEFEWDPVKEKKNISNHDGIDFQEASTVFGDPLEITINDPDHSDGEYRYLSLGRSNAGRLLVVSYTERAGKIRIISARHPEIYEKRQYENG